MSKKIYIVFLFLSFNCLSQLKPDSIFNSIDTFNNFSKKVNFLESVFRKNRLSNKEFNLILNKLNSFKNQYPEKLSEIVIQEKIGNLYLKQSKTNKALEEYFKLLSIAEKNKNNFFIGSAHDHIAETYQLLDNKIFAQKHFYYTLIYFEKTDSLNPLADVYNLLGTNYKNLKQFDSSLKYHEKSLALRIKTKNKKGISYSYNNIALVYMKKSEFTKAEQYLRRSLEIKRSLGDDKGIAGSLINLGEVYTNRKQYIIAKSFYEEGINYALQAKAGVFYKTGILNMANMFFNMGDYRNSAIYYSKNKNITDSLREEETSKQIAELTAQYDVDRKDAEILIQQEQLRAQQAENTKQKFLIIASGVAILMMLITIFFVYRSYKLNKLNSQKLSEKNKEIEEKNKEIADSINYAKSIQQSLLTSKSILDKNLKDYFILYKPKDIVSGDFYWGAETENAFILACLDCTGHGVPGAFMSLIGKENLDKAILKTNKPGEILHELNKGVKKSLNQENNNSRDGMDVAVLLIEKSNNDITKIKYAGANRPLYYIKTNLNQLEEIKPTKQAIGGLTSVNQNFEEHDLLLKKGDTLYLSTDGFADQFGFEKNKKLTTKRFKELLEKISSQDIANQRKLLEDFFTVWQGNNDQLDDLLVIGIKI